MAEDRQAALETLRASGWLAPYGEGLAGALLAEGALRRLPAGRWPTARVTRKPACWR